MQINLAKLNDFTGVIVVLVGGALGADAMLDDTGNRVTSLEYKLDMIITKTDNMLEENEELTRRANMNLWIERARQSDSLVDLPPFPPRN